MARIRKRFYTETAHRLMDHPGDCKYLHGHSYLFEITIQGILDDGGMIIDFGDLKRIAWGEVISKFDHAVALAVNDPLVEALRKFDLKMVIMDGRPTAENMAKKVWNELTGLFKMERENDSNFPELYIAKVKVWETLTSCAEV